VLSSEQRLELDQHSIMNILKDVQHKDIGRPDQDEHRLDTPGHTQRNKINLYSSTNSNNPTISNAGSRAPGTLEKELQTPAASVQKRLMSQQAARRRQGSKAQDQQSHHQGDQFMSKRLQEMERRIKSPEATTGSYIGQPHQRMHTAADLKKRR